MHPNDVATDLLEAFNTGDLERMRGLLAPDLVAWVTNADGDADRVIGRDEYLRRVAAMDLPSAQYRATLTQSPAAIDEHLVLLMVEIRAERNSRRLHNFAAHVLRVDEGRVIEWRMADAKPARATSSGPDVALHRCSAYLLDLFRGFRRYGHAGPAGTLSPISTSNADSFDALIVDPRTRGPASGTAAGGAPRRLHWSAVRPCSSTVPTGVHWVCRNLKALERMAFRLDDSPHLRREAV